MSDVNTIDVWIPPDKTYALFGNLTNNTITYESGASIWVPARPDEHMLRGCNYTATGTHLQLQQLAAKLISQALGSAAFAPDPDLKQWWYLNEQDEQFGPFSGRQLSKFYASGVWQREFLICHEPSAVWLPVWLVLQLVGLPATAAPTAAPAKPTAAAAAKPAAAAPAPAPAPAPKHRRKKNRTQQAEAAVNTHNTGAAGPAVGPANRSTADEQLGDAAMSEDEQGEAAALELPAAAAQPAAAAPAPKPKHKKKKKAAAAGANSYSADPAGVENKDNTGAAEEQLRDAVMSEFEQDAAALLAQVALLRQDSGYIEELSRAVDMEIDESGDWQQQQQQQQQAGDLSELPATQLSVLQGGLVSSNDAAPKQQQQQQQQQLVVVLDTNVLLDVQGLALLKQLQRLQESSKAWLQLLVLLPWTVLVELDRLKSRQGGRDGLLVAGQARAAVRHLQAAMAQGSSCSHMYKPQSMQEFRDAAREHSLGDSDKDLVADDRILQCAMHAQQQQQQQQQQQARGGSAVGLVLLTNDLVLQLKAKANSVPAAGLRHLPAITATQQQQQHALLLKLMKAAGLNISHSSTAQANYAAAAAAASAAAAAAAAAAAQPAGPTHAAGHAASTLSHATYIPHQQNEPQQQQQQESRSRAEIAAAAMGLITRLRLALAEKVEHILRHEFEEVWLDVVCAKPPWRDEDLLYVLHKHWRSVLQGHLGSSARLSRQLEDAAKRLMGMHKQLLQQSSSSGGQHSSNAQLKMQRIEADVAVLVVQLLQAFGADAAAQEVAAAAGLAAADSALSLPAAAAAGVSREQEGLGGQALGTAGSGMVARMIAAGRAAAAAATSPRVAATPPEPPPPPPPRAAACALDTLGSPTYSSAAAAAAAGQHRVVRHAVRHQQGQQQQQQQQQQPAVPHYANSSSSAQQAVQCSAAQGNKKQRVAAGEVLQQQQQQAQAPQQQQAQVPSLQQQQQLQALQQQQQQQVCVPQQEQQVCSPQQQQQVQVPQQQQQSPQGNYQSGAIVLLAAAAAGVPAPALQGPCLRLQQLLQYALALLYAVMQPLQAALTQGIAAAHAAAAAVERQVQQVFPQLEFLLQQLQQQLLSIIQQGYQTTDQRVAAVTAAAAAPSLHESALQVGLQLVQLCALLLNDAAAGAAVAAQLTANAAAFAADAVAFLVQSQLGAAVGSEQCLNAAGSAQADGGQFGEVGLLLQQLKGAQQHIQMLLSHAQPGA